MSSPEASVLLVGVSEADSELIASAGCECQGVPGAGELALEGQRPAMVLVNESVAEDGQFLAQLKAHPRLAASPLVLLASASTSPEIIETAWRAGLDDCIMRPLRSDQIQERLRALRPLAPVASLAPARRGPRTVVLVGSDYSYRAQLAELFEHAGLHLVLGEDDESSDSVCARAGKMDLLLVVADIGTREGVAVLSATLKGARGARSEQACPVLVLSERGAGPADGQAKSGIEVIDRAVPPQGVLQKVNALLKRAPQELRAEGRVAFFCPVEFREAGGSQSGPWCSGYSFNVSSGGIFLKTLVPCRPGSAVELRIRLTTTREQLDVTGVVAWANPFQHKRVLSYPVGMGVQFLGAISKKLAQLIDLCRFSGGGV